MALFSLLRWVSYLMGCRLWCKWLLGTMFKVFVVFKWLVGTCTQHLEANWH